LNGVYESVLQEILQIQEHLPEHIMFLQPYKAQPIRKLKKSPPRVDDPMRLLVSTTDNLQTVSYAAEIVGWDDKTQLSSERKTVLERLVNALQSDEGGIYDNAKGEGQSINLLHVWRLRRVNRPFSVTQLVKVEDDVEM